MQLWLTMTYKKIIADIRQAKEHEEGGIYFHIRKKKILKTHLTFKLKGPVVSPRLSHAIRGSSGILSVSAHVNRHKRGHSLVK